MAAGASRTSWAPPVRPAGRDVAEIVARQTPARGKASVRGAAVVALAASLVLAACGGGGGSPSTSPSSGGAQQSNSSADSLPIATAGASHLRLLKFTKCMRSHGEPHFPDPNREGDFSNYDIDPSSPQFQAADHECAKYLPSVGAPTAAQRAQMDQAFADLLRFAKCMRSHGVSDYPDPRRNAGGVTLLIPGVNQSSPAFVRAQQHCSSLPGAPHPP